MNAVLLALVLAGSSSTDAPTLNFVAQIDLGGGARVDPNPFYFSPGIRLGLRFDPVRFGGLFRGLISNPSGLDVGGFVSVDVVRLLLDSERSVSFFLGSDVFARLVAARWNAVVLGVAGIRVLGISLSVVGGAELIPAGGVGEVRLGVDLVELLSLL